VKHILTCRDLTKSFGELKAVDRVSFDVAKGEIFGIAGPNGAGKTTLFNVITKIPYSLDSGKVIFGGEEIQRYSPHEIYRIGIARTFQIPNYLPEQSVFNNIMLGAIFGSNRTYKDNEKKTSEMIKLLELNNYANLKADTLSLLEIKKLMIASALVCNPKILMLDEPFGGLSKQEIAILVEVVKQINKELGVTVIIIEHIMSALMEISNRIMMLHHGQKICEGTPEEISQDERAIKIYLGL